MLPSTCALIVYTGLLGVIGFLSMIYGGKENAEL